MVKILIALLLMSAFSAYSCDNLDERLARIQIIDDAKVIRDAQTNYFRQFRGYGSFQDLVKSDLLPKKFLTEERDGYRYELQNSTDNYRLRIMEMPTAKNSQRSENQLVSLYVDDSGIIRASVDGTKQADAHSDPISRQ